MAWLTRPGVPYRIGQCMETLPQEETRAADMPAGAHRSVDMRDVAWALNRRRRLILVCTAAGLVIGILLALFLKPNFTATAVILPPQQQSSSASLLNQLGSLSSLAGG